MNQIMVIYWSQTGDTEAMTNVVVEGIRKAGKDTLVTEVFNTPADALKDTGIFALGCSAMGTEILEESEVDPSVVGAETFTPDKRIGLSGLYGWGDGRQMRDWQARMTSAGADVVGGEGVIAQGSPGGDALNHYRELGEVLTAVGI